MQTKMLPGGYFMFQILDTGRCHSSWFLLILRRHICFAILSKLRIFFVDGTETPKPRVPILNDCFTIRDTISITQNIFSTKRVNRPTTKAVTGSPLLVSVWIRVLYEQKIVFHGMICLCSTHECVVYRSDSFFPGVISIDSSKKIK